MQAADIVFTINSSDRRDLSPDSLLFGGVAWARPDYNHPLFDISWR